MSDTTINISAESLEGFVSGVFQHAGCDKGGARDMASCLVQTNLWGIDSHGVIRVGKYLDRLEKGAMNGRPQITTLRSDKSLEVLDADNGSGYVAGRAAMARAIELAKQQNIAAVAIINSNHCIQNGNHKG